MLHHSLILQPRRLTYPTRPIAQATPDGNTDGSTTSLVLVNLTLKQMTEPVFHYLRLQIIRGVTTGPTTPMFVLSDVPVLTRTFTDDTPCSNIKTRFRVRSTNAAGRVETAALNITTPAGSAVAKPTDLTLSGNVAIVVSWYDNGTNETGFEIERKVVGGEYAPLATRGSRAGAGYTTYTDSTAVAGTSYQYRVRGVRSTGGPFYSAWAESPVILARNGLTIEAVAWSALDAIRSKFVTDSGKTATNNFGAWALLLSGTDLFIGAGNSPGNEDGAEIVSSTTGATIVTGCVLDEQGVHDMQAQGSDLWVCGTDPTDDWTLGNIYHRDAGGTWTKLRTLPLVIHALGLWHDGSTLWVAAGAHTGDNATWKGRVLKSSDGGQTWTVADVNDYRVYDVAGFDGDLYAIGHNWTGSGYTQDLHVSADAGNTWSVVAGVQPAIKPRLMLHGGALFGVLSTRLGIFKVEAGGIVTAYSTPFMIVDQWNVLESDGTYLYAIDVDGVIWRSSDLAVWTAYTRVPNAVALRWWAGTGLMIGDTGVSARVWRA